MTGKGVRKFVKMEGRKMDDEGTGRVKGVKEVENGRMGEWVNGKQATRWALHWNLGRKQK